MITFERQDTWLADTMTFRPFALTDLRWTSRDSGFRISATRARVGSVFAERAEECRTEGILLLGDAVWR